MMSSAQREWLYRLTLFILLMCFILWSLLHLGGASRSIDEGINLMKARMVQEGYLLHRDIWSDQPPLFTLCLAFAFELFGESVLVARGLIVAFACLGLACTAWMARLLGGRMSSLVAVIFLAFSPQFLELSRSVMIGLPAHALATLAMACGLMALRTRREIWLIAAGVAISMSLLTKPLHPLLFASLGIIIRLWGKSSEGEWWDRWGRKALLLTTAAIAPLLVVLSLFGGRALVRQVVVTYFQRQESKPIQLGQVLIGAVDYALEGGPLYWTGLLLALYGLVLAWRRQDDKRTAIAVWLLGSVVAVCSHAAFRPRYLLLFSFPLAGLLSIGLHDVIRGARLSSTRARRSIPLAVGAIVTMSLVLGTVVELRTALAETCCDRRRTEEEAVALLRSTYTPGSYVISDDGFLPFSAGLLTPPEVTVISLRRMWTGQLATQTLIAASQTYKPEAIILWNKRAAYLPKYIDWVDRHYCLTRAWGRSQRIYTACEMLQPVDGSLVQLGDFSTLSGWSLDILGKSDRVVTPGESILLTVRWRTLNPTDADYHVFCHLGGDMLVAQRDSRPQGGEHPTYRWIQGEEVVDSYGLKVHADAPPGYYPLWVGMYDRSTKDRLPVVDAKGNYVGSAALLTHVRVGRPEFEAPPISQPQEATLGNKVRLLGYDLPSGKVRAGGLVDLALYWQSVQETDTSYTVFVHILDSEDNMVGQWDSIPQGGELPTTTWVPGEVVVDTYEVPIAPEANPGNYILTVGMYDARTGQRLVAMDTHGARLPDDRILLDEIRLSK